MTEDELVDGYLGVRLRAHDEIRAELVARLDPKDSRGRRRGWPTAKRDIEALGYRVVESNDRRGRYTIILGTKDTSWRAECRRLEQTGMDLGSFFHEKAQDLLTGYRRHHPLQ